MVYTIAYSDGINSHLTSVTEEWIKNYFVQNFEIISIHSEVI